MLLSKLTFLIFASFLVKNRRDKESQKHFISAIKNPIGFYLTAYSIDVCLSVFYYPSPVPLAFKNAFVIVYIATTTWLIVGILNGYGMMALSKIAQKSGKKEVINLLIKFLYCLIIFIAILLVLSRLGFDISTIMASLGIGGLAVALATKDIISNFFASVMLIFDNSFSQGDLINCSGVEGNVVETGLRKTTIRTNDNALVFIPNSKIMSENIINWSRRKVGREIKIIVGITYDATPEQIKNILSDIKTMLLTHPQIAKNSEDTAKNTHRYKQNIVSLDDLAGYKNDIFVALNEFGDSSINLLVQCFAKTILKGEFLLVKEEIMLKIMDIIAKNSAQLAFPSRSIYIEKMPRLEILDENSGKK